MPFSDLSFVFAWWGMLAVIGILFLPLANYLFPSFVDRGYIFSKVLGLILTSYVVFILGTLQIVPFSQIVTLIVVIGLGVILYFTIRRFSLVHFWQTTWKIVLLEELLFFAALLFWSFVRAHQPEIRGLEKFMDFGFVNSILRSDYFPPKDMWFTPFSINYYYFGHLATAVLTKLIGIPSFVTYNLMLATLFAFTFTCSFSIGMNLYSELSRKLNAKRYLLNAIVAGLLTAFLVSMAGNLHTIYTFFKPYQTDNPVPITQLAFSPSSFPNSYWYPNATRFIVNTIHEFPIYSFVVADLHGHVLDIPAVLLIIALVFSLIKSPHLLASQQKQVAAYIFLGFLLAVMYMTNIWDGLIYFLLVVAFLFYTITQRFLKTQGSIPRSALALRATFAAILVAISFVGFSLPFTLHFKPFASGVGILCAPKFLTDIGTFGPFLFETEHCQKSPLWQLATLYGFFYFLVITFFIVLREKLREKTFIPSVQDLFIIILICLSSILIVIPEFIYVKDIYPAHYRANTMFKLVYQSFIMLSIASAYIICRLFSTLNSQLPASPAGRSTFKKFVFLLFTFLFLTLVMVFPYFAITSYYGNLQTYQGLDGIRYLNTQYPDDYKAILWINEHIKGQPVVLEAQGDSYTDYARISANTGLPTVLGWTVHEWLWRGTYDIPAPRIAEVQTLYETPDQKVAKQLIDKYNVKLVFVGTLERQKYPSLQEEKFRTMGRVIFNQGTTTIYQTNN